MFVWVVRLGFFTYSRKAFSQILAISLSSDFKWLLTVKVTMSAVALL